ncbi:MAG: CoA ester lyase, partial [Actinomycetota bacterium]|nr:CoA ester lyase [Actinomycetota bacterium]
CNASFAPAPDEVEKAGRIIAAFEEAEAEGRGVVQVDGRMVENLHVEQAHRTLAINAAIEAVQA